MANIPTPIKKNISESELARKRTGGGRGPGGRVMFSEKAKNKKATLRRLIKYLTGNKKLIIPLIIMLAIVTVLNLMYPIFNSRAIDSITITDTQLEVDFSTLYSSLIIMVVLAIVIGLGSFTQQFLSVNLTQLTVKKMRKDLFNKLVHLPISYLDSHQHGDVMSRMTNDVTNIANTVSQSLATIISGCLTIVGCSVIMLVYSPFLTLISMISIALVLIFTKVISKHIRKFFKRQQELLGDLNGHVEEYVTGYKTVAAYTKEDDVNEVFSNISEDLTKVGIKADIISGCMGPIMNLIHNIGFLLIAVFGAFLVIRPIMIGNFVLAATISVGTIQLFFQTSRQFSQPINQIANLYAQIQTALAGAERVFEIMDIDNEIDEGNIELDIEQVKGLVEFKNVSFSYVKDEPVLIDFNAKITPGEKIALVGHTGSGKTTIVNLLMRFYEIDSGNIYLDGINIKDIKKSCLRTIIAIVLQDTVLFSDTIKANILYGNELASNDEMIKAAKTSNSHSFIKRLENKYDTELSSSGGNLSQGQRQLLSITRAVIKDPKVLILDEATSSVDTRTEKNIQDAMVRLMNNRTSIIIAHRLSTIQDADLIIVLDKGKVVESGNHYELLEKQGRYFDLYQTQFAGNQI